MGRIPQYWLLLMMITLSCADQQHDPFSNNNTNRWSEEADFEEKVITYEDENRDVWQKPQVVLDLIEDIQAQTVVDLGAGTGYFAFRLVKKGADVIAVDIDPEMIQFMQFNKARLPPVLQSKFDIRLAEPDDPKLADREADVVLMVNTYVYINDRVNYLAYLHPALDEGGELIIIEFKDHQTEVGPPMNERISYRKMELELTQAGYQVVEIDTTTLEFQYILTAK